MRNAHSAREAKDKQESAQAIAEVKSAAARRHEQMRAAHESEVSSVKKAHGQRVAGLEARVETLERKYSSETKEMKEALLSSRDQYEGFKAKVAREFHSVVITNVPIFTVGNEDAARRFINLVDEFYDRSVKLAITAAAPMHELYHDGRLSFEFQRTESRLLEMQSREYLARPHRP